MPATKKTIDHGSRQKPEPAVKTLGGGFGFGPRPHTVVLRDGEFGYPQSWTFKVEGGALVLVDSTGKPRHAFGPAHWISVSGG
jgi:hypothetical protein